MSSDSESRINPVAHLADMIDRQQKWRRAREVEAIKRALGEAWNVQAGAKVHLRNLSTSDIDSILLALDEAGYKIVPKVVPSERFFGRGEIGA